MKPSERIEKAKDALARVANCAYPDTFAHRVEELIDAKLEARSAAPETTGALPDVLPDGTKSIHGEDLSGFLWDENERKHKSPVTAWWVTANYIDRSTVAEPKEKPGAEAGTGEPDFTERAIEFLHDAGITGPNSAPGLLADELRDLFNAGREYEAKHRATPEGKPAPTKEEFDRSFGSVPEMRGFGKEEPAWPPAEEWEALEEAVENFASSAPSVGLSKEASDCREAFRKLNALAAQKEEPAKGGVA